MNAETIDIGAKNIECSMFNSSAEMMGHGAPIINANAIKIFTCFMSIDLK